MNSMDTIKIFSQPMKQYIVKDYFTSFGNGEMWFNTGVQVDIIGECKIIGCEYYIVLLERYTLDDELILIPKTYF